MENFLHPGRLAKVGIDAGAPILSRSATWRASRGVNITPIVVMFLAWLIVILCFFVLAIQLFITLIEFKLTTLAGFVLVPFALWNKTAFLAEKVLGNVVSSGIKVLVLAVIVGIGSGLFAEFQVHPAEPSIDHSVVVMLASLTLLALGIFGPGIATGLVSGGPQLARVRWPVLRWRCGRCRCRRRRSHGRRRRGSCWSAHGARCRQAGRQRRAGCRWGCQQCTVGVPGRFRFGRRRPRVPLRASAMSPRQALRQPGRRWPMARVR